MMMRLMKFLIGCLVGAVTALLLAPQGNEWRRLLRARVRAYLRELYREDLEGTADKLEGVQPQASAAATEEAVASPPLMQPPPAAAVADLRARVEETRQAVREALEKPFRSEGEQGLPPVSATPDVEAPVPPVASEVGVPEEPWRELVASEPRAESPEAPAMPAQAEDAPADKRMLQAWIGEPFEDLLSPPEATSEESATLAAVADEQLGGRHAQGIDEAEEEAVEAGAISSDLAADELYQGIELNEPEMASQEAAFGSAPADLTPEAPAQEPADVEAAADFCPAVGELAAEAPVEPGEAADRPLVADEEAPPLGPPTAVEPAMEPPTAEESAEQPGRFWPAEVGEGPAAEARSMEQPMQQPAAPEPLHGAEDAEPAAEMPRPHFDEVRVWPAPEEAFGAPLRSQPSAPGAAGDPLLAEPGIAESTPRHTEPIPTVQPEEPWQWSTDAPMQEPAATEWPELQPEEGGVREPTAEAAAIEESEAESTVETVIQAAPEEAIGQPEESADEGVAPGLLDQAEMRRRIEETRTRLKAKAFDAMASGEAALLSRDAADQPAPSAREAPLEDDVSRALDRSLSQDEY